MLRQLDLETPVSIFFALKIAAYRFDLHIISLNMTT